MTHSIYRSSGMSSKKLSKPGTAMQIAELPLEDAAEIAAGNWRRFDSFVWFRQRELDAPDDWALFYTHHHGSGCGLLDMSNAHVIEKELEAFANDDHHDVVFESHSHWAVGHIEGFSVRVFRDGQVTKAFRTYYDLVDRITNYPILDEQDYCEREFEATLKNIDDGAWRLKDEFDLPEEWQEDVYRWLSDYRASEIENRDDQGGYPSEQAMKDAFVGLDFKSL